MIDVKGSERLVRLVRRHETKLEVVSFLGGFLLDIVLLSQPDDIFGILQQLLYFIIVAGLLHYEILFRLLLFRPRGFIRKVWPYRSFLMHFAFGSLLNLYSLFYIKSASVVSSFIFLIFMLGLVVANELPLIKKAKISIKISMYVICIFSFFSILWPVLLGFIGIFPFILSILSTGVVLLLHSRALIQRKKRRVSPWNLTKIIAIPGGVTIAVFMLFYFMRWIPPVPLSVVEQGVYHNIEKRDGNYILTYYRPWWKFWSNYDSTFDARDDDKIFFYAQVYSPTRISDSVTIHWLVKNKGGDWESSDRIPMRVQGGRQRGYRGMAYKNHFRSGAWMVRLETSNGVEISRLYFDVNKLEGELLPPAPEDVRTVIR